ncbi:MAG: F0F1 ATP synthase subunit B [Pseudomonadota bacterium]
MIDLQDPTVWVAVALLAFFALLYYMKVHTKILGALDKRAEDIQNDLEDARKMRDDAQALLAQYQHKQRKAEDAVEGIIEKARKDAESFSQDARDDLQKSLDHRLKLAEEKIARAEADAESEVRSMVVDIAINATEKLLVEKLSKDASSGLVDQSLQEMKAKLN